MELQYPFKPKSNNLLIPGQYWAIPLRNGQFACGIVVQVTKSFRVSPSKTFLAGLVDWLGESPPKSQDIAERKTLRQGVAHIKSIHETGLKEMITGCHPLGISLIEPDYLKSQIGYHPEYCKLMKGLIELRPITRSECEMYPALGVWGISFIRDLAETMLFTIR